MYKLYCMFNNLNLKDKVRTKLSEFSQKIIIVLDSFTVSEMANHAAAGAYSFLLSAAPASLVIVSIASIFINPSSELLARFLYAMESLVGRNISTGITSIISNGRSREIATIFGVINLIWASRLLVLSIQRGIRIVWAGTAKINILRENILTFVAELVVIFLAIALMFFSAVVELIFSLIAAPNSLLFRLLPLKYLISFAPVLAIFIFVFLTYRFLPPERPSGKQSFIGSLLCSVCFIIFSEVIGLFLDATRYVLVYGVLGRMVLALINVYTFFALYFFFAYWVFVSENLDAFLLARCSKTRIPGKKPPNKLELSLFKSPKRLINRYLKTFKPNHIIYRKGEKDSSAYFVLSGEVGIYIRSSAEKPLTKIESGEFFGEMSGLNNEKRTTTAISEQESEILVIPSRLFEKYLMIDRTAERRIAEKLSERLRDANEHTIAISKRHKTFPDKNKKRSYS